MTKILFVCHGNICRSPMAEYIMKRLAKDAGIDGQLEIASAATSTEELGNPVYPPAKRVLNAHGISCENHHARQMTKADCDYYDMIIVMENFNIRNALPFTGQANKHKLSLLLNHAGKHGREIADPWYTGDFDTAWNEISEGCEGLIEELKAKI